MMAQIQVGPGVYEMAGQIFVVKLNREKTRVYAKKLIASTERVTEEGAHVRFDFEYAPGAIFDLRPEDRMPLERAKELIVKYGRCLNCGRTLKLAESVERGIGPICFKAFGAPQL